MWFGKHMKHWIFLKKLGFSKLEFWPNNFCFILFWSFEFSSSQICINLIAIQNDETEIKKSFLTWNDKKLWQNVLARQKVCKGVWHPLSVCVSYTTVEVFIRRRRGLTSAQVVSGCAFDNPQKLCSTSIGTCLTIGSVSPMRYYDEESRHTNSNWKLGRL